MVSSLLRKFPYVFLVVMLASAPAYGSWSDIPDNLYSTMYLADYLGRTNVIIVFADWQWQMASQLYKGAFSEQDLAVFYDLVSGSCAAKWGEGARFLLVVLWPLGGREGTEYWYPWDVVFVQAGSAYHVTASEILIGFSDSFSGRVYGQMNGYIRVPDEIDYARSFDIWYDDAKATLGPINTIQP